MTPPYSLVSFIIPTYNAQAYIGHAIDSALAQTYSNIEVIVVDDGSTDDTVKLIADRYVGDPRVRCFTQANQGPSAARNRAAQAARGEFLHLLDADEFLQPTKVKQSYELFAAHPEATVVYGHGIPVEADGKTEIPLARPPLPSGDVFCEWLTGRMSGGTYSVTSSFMIRRQAFLEIGGFDPAMRYCEDWDLWLRLSSAGHTFFALDEELVYYRRLTGGLHANQLNIALGRLRTIQKARHYPGRDRCLSDSAYDRIEAGRWQTVAMRYWELGQRAEARAAFREAIRIDPTSAQLRRLYTWFTYFLPPASVDLVGSLSTRLKGKPRLSAD